MQAQRRDLMLTAMLAAMVTRAKASPLNPAQTIIEAPDAHKWTTNDGWPERSVEMCAIAGATNKPGLYYTLVRWWPGYMSAPHSYVTDRFCIVVSGTWWCNSGAEFDVASCVPVPAGSFVHRVAATPHYDGVIRGQAEPAVIAICGIGPISFIPVDPATPGWRAV